MLRARNAARPQASRHRFTVVFALAAALALAVAGGASALVLSDNDAAARVVHAAGPRRLPADLPHRLRGGLAWELVQAQAKRDGEGGAPRATVPVQWFDQKLNHSDPNSPTFKQACVAMPPCPMPPAIPCARG